MKENKSVGESILGVFFIIWFIASIVGMVIFADINEYVTLVLVGQYFFIFSMLFFSQQDRELMPLIHLTVGIGFMVVPLIVKVWPKFTDMNMKEYFFDLGVPILSIITGYVFLIKSRFVESKELFNNLYRSSLLFYILGIIRIIMVCL